MKDKIAKLMSQSSHKIQDQVMSQMMFQGAYNAPEKSDPLTVDKLKEIMASLPCPESSEMPFSFMYPTLPNHFLPSFQDVHEALGIPERLLGGTRVYQAPMVPKFQLSEKVTVSDEFRQKMNAWLADFFGMESMIGEGRVLMCNTMFGKALVMGPGDDSKIDKGCV